MLYLYQIADLLADKIWIKGQSIEDNNCVTDQNIIWRGEGKKTDKSLQHISTLGLFSSPAQG